MRPSSCAFFVFVPFPFPSFKEKDLAMETKRVEAAHLFLLLIPTLPADRTPASQASVLALVSACAELWVQRGSEP